MDTMRSGLLAMGFVTALLLSGSVAEAQQGFQVVVNETNSVSRLSASQVSRLFLKRMTRWESGEPAVPVDLRDVDGTRSLFSRSVHGRAPDFIRSHWQQQIFSGRGTPPEELASEQEILAFVRTNPNAIGYVSAGVTLPSGVRALEITRE